MKQVKITSELARRLILHAQLLNGKTKLARGKDGIAQTIDRLGYIQIDTIAVIKRSHHHTLWTRRNDYKEEMLHHLQTIDRRIFEYWGHAMSYMPMSDYRFCLPRMRNFHNPTNKWIKNQLENCAPLLDQVLERIRKEGPLSSKDFKKSPENRGASWWNWKPAKVALEFLFWRGDLMVTHRHNFQKIYDLTERVLPGNIDTSMPDKDELGQYLVRRTLAAFGVAQERDILKYMQPDTARDSDFQIANRQVISKSLNDLMEAREVIPVTIEEESTEYYALSEIIENVSHLKKASSHVYILSPFDNCIIQRARTKRMFGFEYTLECYVPADKRRYGYFVLPILWGDNFVGRLDSKANRKEKIFIIRNLVFESQFDSFDAFLLPFTKKLMALARFNNCDKIIFENITPKKITKEVKRCTESAMDQTPLSTSIEYLKKEYH